VIVATASSTNNAATQVIEPAENMVAAAVAFVNHHLRSTLIRIRSLGKQHSIRGRGCASFVCLMSRRAARYAFVRRLPAREIIILQSVVEEMIVRPRPAR
jgi:hypothetical protein